MLQLFKQKTRTWLKDGSCYEYCLHRYRLWLINKHFLNWISPFPLIEFFKICRYFGNLGARGSSVVFECSIVFWNILTEAQKYSKHVCWFVFFFFIKRKRKLKWFEICISFAFHFSLVLWEFQTFIFTYSSSSSQTHPYFLTCFPAGTPQPSYLSQTPRNSPSRENGNTKYLWLLASEESWIYSRYFNYHYLGRSPGPYKNASCG